MLKMSITCISKYYCYTSRSLDGELLTCSSDLPINMHFGKFKIIGKY